MTTTENDKQDKPLHGPNLILDVKNFGPIAEAKNIEFKPMTVFVGPSNTGKTYLALLLHAISRGLHETFVRFDSHLTDDQVELYTTLRTGLNDLLDRHEIATYNSPDEAETRLQFDWSKTSREVQRTVNDFHSDWLGFASDEIDESIRAFFQVSRIDDLLLKSAPHPSDLDFQLSLRRTPFQWSVGYQKNAIKVSSALFPLILTQSFFVQLMSLNDQPDTFMNRFAVVQLLSDISTSFSAQFHDLQHCSYFPAARSGIIASHHTLNRGLVANDSRSGPERSEAAQRNRIVSDFLENLLRVDERFKNSDERAVELAGVLERVVLDGTIDAINPQYGPPEFVYAQNDLTIPLIRSSSMVTELAPIILFLKHFIRFGSILIVEEPEAHLHPDAQQKFAAALALLVRSGFRILITTHSHYMVEQLSAFVNASKLDKPTRKRVLALGGALDQEDIYLNEEETAVYSFQLSPEHGGSVVKEIHMGEEYEYGPDDHSDATVDQFNRLQRVLEAREVAESNGLD